MDRKQIQDLAIEDFEYFKKEVKKGARRLAGDETDENVRTCFHCKLWRRTNKFVKEMELLGELRNIKSKGTKK